MASEVSVALRIQAFVDQAKAAVQGFEKEINGLGKSGQQASQALNEVGGPRSASQLNSSAESAKSARTEVGKLTENVQLLTKAWLAFQALKGLGDIARDMFSVSDQAVLLAARVRLVTSSQAEAVEVQRQLYEQSQRLQVPLEASTNLFARLNPVVQKLNGTYRDTLTLNEAVAASLRISGASTEESASTIQQFTQALQSGKLGGDEFRGLAEAAPRLMQGIADAIGVPRGALRQMSEESKLTSAVVANAVIKASAQIKADAQALPQTVGGAFTQLGNAYQRWISDNDDASASAHSVAEAVRSVANNFEEAANTVITTATIAAAVITSRLIGSTTAYITKLVEERLALIAKTQATLAAAEAENVLAAARLRAAEASAVNVGTVGKLAAAQRGAAVASEALTAAQGALSAATSLGVGGALRGILGLLGGPVGIITTLGLAGAAWLAYKQKADTGATGGKETTEQELARLKAVEESLTHQAEIKQKTAEIVALGTRASNLQQQREAAGSQDYKDRLGQEIAGLLKEQSDLAQIIARLQNSAAGAAGSPAGTSGPLTDDPKVALDKLRKDLNNRLQIEKDYQDNLQKIRSTFKAAIDKESDPAKQEALAQEQAETIAQLNEKRASALAGLSKAAFDRAKADAQLSKATLEANLTLLQDTITRGNAVIEQALKDGNVTIDAAYQARLGSLESQTEAERKVLEAERTELERAMAKATKPEERSGIEANLVQVNAKLKLLQPSLDEAKRQLVVWKSEQENELANITAKIRVDVSGLTGKFDRTAAEQQLKLQYESDYKRTGTISDPAEQQAQRQRLDLLVQAGVAQAELNAKMEEAQRIQQQLAVQEGAINNLAQTGQISQIEAEARIKAAREAQLPALREIVGQLSQMRDALPAEASAAIDQATTSIGQLQNQVQAATPVIVDFGTQAKNAAIDGLADAAATAVTNFSNLRTSISSTLKQIAGDIVRSGIKRFLTEQFAPSGSSGGSTGSGIFSVIGSAISKAFLAKGGWTGAVRGFSDGGKISGPGTGTSDSIPAIVDGNKPIAVSNNEFIQPEKAVNHYGLGFMEAVRTLRFPKPRFAFGGLVQAHQAARFATGGSVASAAGVTAAPAISIEFVNKGTPQRMVSQQQTTNGKDTMVSVVLEDLASGGPISRSIRGSLARGS